MVTKTTNGKTRSRRLKPESTQVNNDDPSQILENKDLADGNTRATILKYANDVMHDEISAGNIVVIAIHNKADPYKFTIVADSVYDKKLENISLVFEDAEDFKRIFPEFNAPPPVNLPPNMEMDSRKGVAVPIHKDPYKIRAAMSFPKPANPDVDGPDNVLNEDNVLAWSVNKFPTDLLIDLGEDVQIGTVWIKWGRPIENKHYNFTIGVATETQMDNKEGFAVISHLQQVFSSGVFNAYDSYNLATDPEMLTKARYVLIKVHGNTEAEDNWASIVSVKVTKAVSIRSAEQKEPNNNI